MYFFSPTYVPHTPPISPPTDLKKLTTEEEHFFYIHPYGLTAATFHHAFKFMTQTSRVCKRHQTKYFAHEPVDAKSVSHMDKQLSLN